VAGKREAGFPRTVQAILQEALQLRDRRQQGQISDRGVAVARGRLEARVDRRLQRRYPSPGIGAWPIICYASATLSFLS